MKLSKTRASVLEEPEPEHFKLLSKASTTTWRAKKFVTQGFKDELHEQRKVDDFVREQRWLGNTLSIDVPGTISDPSGDPEDYYEELGSPEGEYHHQLHTTLLAARASLKRFTRSMSQPDAPALLAAAEAAPVDRDMDRLQGLMHGLMNGRGSQEVHDSALSTSHHQLDPGRRQSFATLSDNELSCCEFGDHARSPQHSYRAAAPRSGALRGGSSSNRVASLPGSSQRSVVILGTGGASDGATCAPAATGAYWSPAHSPGDRPSGVSLLALSKCQLPLSSEPSSTAVTMTTTTTTAAAAAAAAAAAGVTGVFLEPSFDSVRRATLSASRSPFSQEAVTTTTTTTVVVPHQSPTPPPIPLGLMATARRASCSAVLEPVASSSRVSLGRPLHSVLSVPSGATLQYLQDAAQLASGVPHLSGGGALSPRKHLPAVRGSSRQDLQPRPRTEASIDCLSDPLPEPSYSPGSSHSTSSTIRKARSSTKVFAEPEQQAAQYLISEESDPLQSPWSVAVDGPSLALSRTISTPIYAYSAAPHAFTTDTSGPSSPPPAGSLTSSVAVGVKAAATHRMLGRMGYSRLHKTLEAGVKCEGELAPTPAVGAAAALSAGVSGGGGAAARASSDGSSGTGVGSRGNMSIDSGRPSNGGRPSATRALFSKHPAACIGRRRSTVSMPGEESYASSMSQVQFVSGAELEGDRATPRMPVGRSKSEGQYMSLAAAAAAAELETVAEGGEAQQQQQQQQQPQLADGAKHKGPLQPTKPAVMKLVHRLAGKLKIFVT